MTSCLFCEEAEDPADGPWLHAMMMRERPRFVYHLDPPDLTGLLTIVTSWWQSPRRSTPSWCGPGHCRSGRRGRRTTRSCACGTPGHKQTSSAEVADVAGGDLTLGPGRVLGVSTGQCLLIAHGFSICRAAAVTAVDGVTDVTCSSSPWAVRPVPSTWG